MVQDKDPGLVTFVGTLHDHLHLWSIDLTVAVFVPVDLTVAVLVPLDGEWETLDIQPLSSPPELPDVMKPQEAPHNVEQQAA